LSGKKQGIIMIALEKNGEEMTVKAGSCSFGYWCCIEGGSTSVGGNFSRVQ
jgi:hypothetical protein